MKLFTGAVMLGLVMSVNAQGVTKQRYGDTSTHVNPSDFPLTLHVTRCYLTGAVAGLRVLAAPITVGLDVLINGRKLELVSTQSGLGLLHVGDYKGRLIRDDERKSGEFSATYELLLADGTHYLLSVVGESE